MRRIQFVTLLIILTLGMLLSGCNAFAPGAAPTPNPASQQATIDAAITQAMQTVSADLTSTAAVLPPASTSTTAPTQEPTATFTPAATATLFVPTSTRVPVTPKPTATATPAAYSCELKSTSPAAGTKLTINVDFDASWVVKNNGTKSWELGLLDLQYVDGTKMQSKGDIFDVSTVVAPDKETTLIVDMDAPATAGKYTATWALTMDGKTLCKLPVSIEAVNP